MDFDEICITNTNRLTQYILGEIVWETRDQDTTENWHRRQTIAAK